MSAFGAISRVLGSASRHLTTIAVTAALTFTLTTLAGVALAAATGTINACVGASGKLTIVSATTACGNNETPLSWNQQGPPGPQGPAGVSGIQHLVSPEFPQGTFSIFADGSTYSSPHDCSTSLCMVRIYCPTGKVAVGGRYFVTDNVTGTAYVNVSSAGTFHYGPGTIVTAFRQLGDGYILEYTSANVPAANVPTSFTVAAECATAN